MSEIITDTNNNAFIEQKCCIELQGHKFCSGGSYLCQRVKDGKFEGILYACHNPDPEIGMYVSSWDGTLKIRVNYWKKEYRDNFGGLRQDIYFVYNGRYFWGKWYGKEWSDIVRCIEISEKSYFGYEPSKSKFKGMNNGPMFADYTDCKKPMVRE